jgi:ABC-type Mn2+/Zn2+ transport system permease subunit
MASFFTISALLGVVAVIAGTIACFQFDLPLGPAIVGAAALELVPGALLGLRRA